jgi:hypothetical protein
LTYTIPDGKFLKKIQAAPASRLRGRANPSYDFAIPYQTNRKKEKKTGLDMWIQH